MVNNSRRTCPRNAVENNFLLKFTQRIFILTSCNNPDLLCGCLRARGNVFLWSAFFSHGPARDAWCVIWSIFYNRPVVVLRQVCLEIKTLLLLLYIISGLEIRHEKCTVNVLYNEEVNDYIVYNVYRINY